jgi:hypothetical protein
MCGLTMWDAEKRITNEHRGMVANSPDGHVDGNAKMPMALKLSHAMKVKISEANAWRMVYNRQGAETSADHTTRLHNVSTLKKLGFEERAKGNG